MTFFDLKYPILQAPIGSAATPQLAAAVSNSGGMGSLALTWTPPERAASQVATLRAATNGLFFVNYVLAFAPRSLEVALETGAPAVSFSWGQPGHLIKRVHEFDALVGVQVATLDGAKQALDDGADFLICQGVEAGGHVQSTSELALLLISLIFEADLKIPIVAAGGISNGKDIARAFRYGAAGVMLGTRFVATAESNAHDEYKQAIVDAKRGEATYTLCFDGGWPLAGHRVLRNKTLEMWEAAGCPPAGNRPGEGDIIAEVGQSGKVTRYDISLPVKQAKGDVLECTLYAGAGSHNIVDIPSVADLLTSLWSEYEENKAIALSEGEELTEENYAGVINQLTTAQKVDFYYAFAAGLTVATRGGWTDGEWPEGREVSAAELVEAMKGINEISHRLLEKGAHERAQDHYWEEADIIRTIRFYIDLAPIIEEGVFWAMRRAYQQVRLK